MKKNDGNWSLICPFLNESRNFALGVEFGLLFAEMRLRESKGEKRMQGYFSRANQESILLMFNRCGWCVFEMKQHDESWFWLVVEKA